MKKQEILNVEQACKELSITKGTLAIWRSQGRINYFKIGKNTFYNKGHIEELKNNSTVYYNKYSQRQEILKGLKLN